MVIALRRRSAASKHHGGEGHAEHINRKEVVNIGIEKNVRWSRLVDT